MAVKKYWLSPVGTHDDYGDEIKDIIIDGRTKEGPWALMTPKSFKENGWRPEEWQGYGQMYQKQSDGKWLKIKG